MPNPTKQTKRLLNNLPSNLGKQIMRCVCGINTKAHALGKQIMLFHAKNVLFRILSHVWKWAYLLIFN